MTLIDLFVGPFEFECRKPSVEQFAIHPPADNSCLRDVSDELEGNRFPDDGELLFFQRPIWVEKRWVIWFFDL